MNVQPVTLNLPKSLYNRIRRRAEKSRRTVEAELLDVVAAAIPASEELSEELADAILGLQLLEDESLWRAARSHLPAESVTEMERLHQKRQQEGLSETEIQTLNGLMRQYERFMLVRAQAAVLLNQRGHDVSSLIAGT